jgi:raffinose/stachyose/melibiose transport system permease protein
MGRLVPMSVPDRPAPAPRRTPRLLRGVRRDHLVGWLFVLPALGFYAMFVLQPLGLSLQYSFYDWNGVGAATWVGLDNYGKVFSDDELLNSIFNAFKLIFFFTVIPVSVGLVTASIIRGAASGRFGTVSRTVLFLPQIIPLVAAGIMWNWVLSKSGTVNQILTAIGLGDITRAWLGDFDWALAAVGFIGIWVLLGLMTLLLLTGMSKIDPALYESARIDGASAWKEFRAITVPSVRNELAVCLTVTVIAALSAFDVIYISTNGGPGFATLVPGLKIYVLAFVSRDVGTASALAVVLMVLVLIAILPIQRLVRESDS